MNLCAHGLRADRQPPARPALIAIAAALLAASAMGCAAQPALADAAASDSPELAHAGATAAAVESAPAGGDEPAGQAPLPPLRNEDTRKAFWRMLASLAVALALVAVAAVVGRKFLPRLASQGRRQLRVIETIHVAPRNAVHLMKVGDRVFMLGSTKEGLSTLGDVTDAVAVAPNAAEEAGDA